MYTITIGDKAYSSWSLRGWLLLAGFGIRFEEEAVRMYDPAFDAMKARHAPARTVPILTWREDGAVQRVWDTAAIAETLAERHPAAGIWPRDAVLRRIARILVAEMHSGFGILRAACPMNLHRIDRPRATPPDGLDADVAAVETLWDWALASSGGPWLAGPEFSAADVFFAPVTFRFTSYRLGTGRSAAYVARLQSHPAVARWKAEALADPRRIDYYATFD